MRDPHKGVLVFWNGQFFFFTCEKGRVSSSQTVGVVKLIVGMSNFPSKSSAGFVERIYLGRIRRGTHPYCHRD